MIKLGDKVCFRPAATYDHSAGFPDELGITVEGTVEYINEKHAFYRVRYTLPGCEGHECFKMIQEGSYHENNCDFEP